MRGRKEARDRRTSGLLGMQPQYLRAAGAQTMLMRKLAAKPQLRLQAAERHVPTKNGPSCTGALRALHHASGLERAHAVSLLSWSSFFPRAVYAGCARRAVCSPVLPCAVLCVHVHVHSHAHVNVNIHPSGPAGADRIESRRGRGIWRRAYRLGGAEPSIGWCSATASTIEQSIPWPFRSFFRQKFCLRRRRPACTSHRPQKC